MKYLLSAVTDTGVKKNKNQDSLTVKSRATPKGEAVFAVMCDGVGGLNQGEVASASVIDIFSHWFIYDFPSICNPDIDEELLKSQWSAIIAEQNERIMDYGKQKGLRLGTTVTVMLFHGQAYYILNVGDTRAYEITDRICQLTEDHTLIQQELKSGKITYEQSLTDTRKNILLQCVGASQVVYPDIYYGEIKENAVYMLCTDGFRHRITEEEIYEGLRPELLISEKVMNEQSEGLVHLNMQRKETDNISVITIRTF